MKFVCVRQCKANNIRKGFQTLGKLLAEPTVTAISWGKKQEEKPEIESNCGFTCLMG